MIKIRIKKKQLQENREETERLRRLAQDFGDDNAARELSLHGDRAGDNNNLDKLLSRAKVYAEKKFKGWNWRFSPTKLNHSGTRTIQPFVRGYLKISPGEIYVATIRSIEPDLFRIMFKLEGGSRDIGRGRPILEFEDISIDRLIDKAYKQFYTWYNREQGL